MILSRYRYHPVTVPLQFTVPRYGPLPFFKRLQTVTLRYGPLQSVTSVTYGFYEFSKI